MTLQKLKLLLAIMIVLTLVTALTAMLQSSSVAQLRENYAVLTKQIGIIELVKARWSAQESQNDLNYLKNHPSLLKQEKHGESIYFEFDNLSSSEFNALSNKILNSMLKIKKLSLKRNGVSKGYISVEIEL